MASVTKRDIPIESEFMTQFWALIKEFYIPEAGDDYWTALRERADETYAACPTEMAKKLLVAYMDYLADKYKADMDRGAL